MSKKVIIKKAKLIKSPIIVDSPEAKTSDKKSLNYKPKEGIFSIPLVKYIIAPIITGIILFYLIGFIISRGNKATEQNNESSIEPKVNVQDSNLDKSPITGDNKVTEQNNKPKVIIQDSELENSPIIVDSPGAIVGDKNIINKLDIPEPQFLYKEIYKNKLIEHYETFGDDNVYENVYETKFKLTIESKTGLNEITLISPRLIVLDIVPFVYGVINWNTATGTYKNEKVRILKITNPVGPYDVKVITNKPIVSNIEPQIIYK